MDYVADARFGIFYVELFVSMSVSMCDRSRGSYVLEHGTQIADATTPSALACVCDVCLKELFPPPALVRACQQRAKYRRVATIVGYSTDKPWQQILLRIQHPNSLFRQRCRWCLLLGVSSESHQRSAIDETAGHRGRLFDKDGSSQLQLPALPSTAE